MASRCNSAFGIAVLAQIVLLQIEAAVLGRNALNRLTIGVAEGGAQRFVPGDEAVQGAAQCAAVQLSGQPQPPTGCDRLG